ncbi:MAG: fumarylacetoacetate hydrolase family protein [Polaromonas sp.]|nr:fumarylacetoacetate hydrolase family protein [Polaromonas sp.]
MALWIRYEAAASPDQQGQQGQTGFGLLDGGFIAVCRGDMFGDFERTGQLLPLESVSTAIPCTPGKFIGLWNNYHSQAAKQGLSLPEEPLYFIKAASSYCAHDRPFDVPPSYQGRVVYEGELGLVIGKTCKNVNIEEAGRAIFGVTCVNDVTALDLITRDASFAQWTRAKSFDTFGIFGPVIATDLDLSALRVKTLVNGRERQNYLCRDMIFSPPHIVSALSKEMTLYPGDVIACGTSLGVLPIKPGTVVEVSIDGIGVLRNTFAPPISSIITADSREVCP